MTGFTADLHAAPKTEVIGKEARDFVEFSLIRLQRSKADITHSLHIRPNGWTPSGLQTTDLLGYLDFERGTCPFLAPECYARRVPASLDLSAFGQAFSQAYNDLKQADQHLRRCGIYLDQPEGWGFFHGSASQPDKRLAPEGGGDGHTASASDRLKEAEDENFTYLFSWLKGERVKGWTTHYRPKHPPLSAEVQAAFKFLQLQTFSECPFFDFEPCFWRFTSYKDEDLPFNRGTEEAHRAFEAHVEHFSASIQHLLAVQAAVGPFGMTFIPPVASGINRALGSPSPILPAGKGPVMAKTGAKQYKYDVAISFAGPQRALAEQLATLTRQAGYQVFYDNFYPEQLWGKDLTVFFDDIYRKDSRFCVIFVSQEYAERLWTSHEHQSARARALHEKGKEYILPIRIDDTELPGMPDTIGYLSMKQYSIEQIAQILIQKMRQD